MEIKEFEISIVLSNENNKYTLDEIIDLIDNFCEENDLTMGGKITEL